MVGRLAICGTAERACAIGNCILASGSGDERLAGGEGGSRSALWRFSTKYYEAEANMEWVEEGAGLNPIGGGAHAIVMCIDASGGEGFGEAIGRMKGLDDDDEEGCDEGREADVRLVVGVIAKNESGGAQAGTALHNGAEEWLATCREYGFEFVLACPCSSEGDDLQNTELDVLARAVTGRGEVMKDCAGGMARVVEALHATMWPDLRMKEEMQRSPIVLTADGEDQGVEEGGEEVEGGQHHQCVGEEEEETQGRGNGTEVSIEQQMEAFEKLMGDVANARERAAEMPDEQRREFAAEIAMKMMASMEGLDF